eukprot:2211622-Rhodomonas_salina.1
MPKTIQFQHPSIVYPCGQLQDTGTLALLHAGHAVKFLEGSAPQDDARDRADDAPSASAGSSLWKDLA